MEAGSRSPGCRPVAETPLTHDSLTLPGTGLRSSSRKLFPFAQLSEAPDLVLPPPELLPLPGRDSPSTQPTALCSAGGGLTPLPHHFPHGGVGKAPGWAAPQITVRSLLPTSGVTRLQGSALPPSTQTAGLLPARQGKDGPKKLRWGPKPA